jgi:glycosyltransferase involved in cell wall biosynthesis
MPDHVVVVIAYNEEQQIPGLLDGLAGRDVLAVVDGDDRTADIAKSYGVDVFKGRVKRGYGGALVDGLICAYASGFVRATVMDVGTCDPRFLDYNTEADILVRARETLYPSARYVLSKIAAFSLSLSTKTIVRDATFGYRTYKLESVVPLLKDLRTNGHSTNMELLGLAIKAGLSIEYTPVPYTLDKNSQLKAKDILEALRTTCNLVTTHQS